MGPGIEVGPRWGWFVGHRPEDPHPNPLPRGEGEDGGSAEGARLRWGWCGAPRPEDPHPNPLPRGEGEDGGSARERDYGGGGAGRLDRKTPHPNLLPRGEGEDGGSARERDHGAGGSWGVDRKTLTPTLSHGERGKTAARRGSVTRRGWLVGCRPEDPHPNPLPRGEGQDGGSARERDQGAGGSWGVDRKTLTPTLSHGERGKTAARRGSVTKARVARGVSTGRPSPQPLYVPRALDSPRFELMGRDRPTSPGSSETVGERGRPGPAAGPEPEQLPGPS